jgi:hypothetical protein
MSAPQDLNVRHFALFETSPYEANLTDRNAAFAVFSWPHPIQVRRESGDTRLDQYIDPDALNTLVGASLMYHGSGDDWQEPLEFFAPTISDFWFVDVGYFRCESAETSRPLASKSPLFELTCRELLGPSVSTPEQREHNGVSYPHIEPCLLIEKYMHTASGIEVTIRRRRGYGERTLPFIDRLGVFVHRGDSPGESGSNVRWLSHRRIGSLLSHLLNGGLIVTDGSLSDARETRKFQSSSLSSEEAFQNARAFAKWGYEWHPVGWLAPRRGPTLIWKVTSGSTSESVE